MLLPAFHTWRSCLSTQRWTACLGCPCSSVDLNLALSDCETRLVTKAPAAPRSHREPLLVREEATRQHPGYKLLPGVHPQSRSPWAEP